MNIKKMYQPRKEFKEQTKTLFLAAVREKLGSHASEPTFAFRYFIRGAASGIAFMLVLAAAATYADQKNVGPGNLLYPLKRSQESIKVVFTKEEKKPALHLELANRRLKEIEEVRSQNPQSSKVAELTQDFKQEVEHSLMTIQGNGPNIPPNIQPEVPVMIVATASAPVGMSTELPPQKENKEEDDKANKESKYNSHSFRESKEKSSDDRLVVCESWRGIIESDDSAVEEVLAESPKVLERFNDKCRHLFEALPASESEVELKQ